MIMKEHKDRGCLFNNKYEQIKLLGEGSFGKAFLVECIEDKSLAVIKTIELGAMSEDEKNEALLESKILEKLQHPNIIKFKEVFLEKNSRLNIVMDYADGGDLQQRIKSMKNSRFFSESQILDWFTQTCLAIKHIHDRKILHRDVKSQNIFLTKNGLVKLGDFGIAKCLDLTIDKVKTIVGTPYYLSPELLQNRPYSFKNDIWALGVLLYEMCCLKMPFEAPNLPILSLKIIKCSYTPISDRYSKELRTLVSNCLNVDPIKRPSVKEILVYPIIASRIKRFLNEVEFSDEFSHTIMHKFNILSNPSLVENSLNRASNENQYHHLNSDIVSRFQKPIIKNDIREKVKEYKKISSEPKQGDIRESQGHPNNYLIISAPNNINANAAPSKQKQPEKIVPDKKRNLKGPNDLLALMNKSTLETDVNSSKKNKAREKSNVKIEIKKKMDSKDLHKRDSNSSANNDKQKRSDSRGSGAEEENPQFCKFLKEMNNKFNKQNIEIVRPPNQYPNRFITDPKEEKFDKDKELQLANFKFPILREKKEVGSNSNVNPMVHISNSDVGPHVHENVIESENFQVNANLPSEPKANNIRDYRDAIEMCVILKNLELEANEADYFENADENIEPDQSYAKLAKEFEGLSQELINDAQDEVDIEYNGESSHESLKLRLTNMFGKQLYEMICDFITSELNDDIIYFNYEELICKLMSKFNNERLKTEKENFTSILIDKLPDIYSVILYERKL